MTNASDIVKLLGERHRKDVFVPECKNGPTWGALNLLRLDAWALRRSWSHFATFGYEVKVTRSDFERDHKFVGYQDLCHHFSFVCPSKLIVGPELPPGVGLIWVSDKGKLVTKVKPQRRDPDDKSLTLLLAYVLMSRSKICEPGMVDFKPSDPLDAYRDLVDRARARGELASFVRGHIAETFGRQEKELSEMRDKVRTAERLREFLAEAGVPWPETHWQSWEAQKEINDRVGKVDHQIVREMRGLRDALTRHIERVETA